jgi:hypothetical protein
MLILHVGHDVGGCRLGMTGEIRLVERERESRELSGADKWVPLSLKKPQYILLV